jgi:hypothetical protein
MAEDPTDVTLDILKKIQDGIGDLRERLERVAAIVQKHRRDGAAMLIMMRATVGFFDDRVGDVEGRVTRLESQKS